MKKVNQTEPIHKIQPQKFFYIKMWHWYQIFLLATIMFALLFSFFNNSTQVPFVLTATFMGNILLAIILFTIERFVLFFGNKKTLQKIIEWANNKYGIVLDENQARPLATRSELNIFAKNIFLSKSTIISEEINKRKMFTKISLIEIKGELSLFNVEEKYELPTKKIQEELEFFTTLWKEVSKNGGFFTYAKIDEDKPEPYPIVLTEVKNGIETNLFWSDPLRAQLYNTNDENKSSIFIPLEAFVQVFMPEIGLKNRKIGLNWGDEERTFNVEDIRELIIED